MVSNANAVEVRRDDTPTPIRTDDRFSRDQIDLIKQTVAVGATDLELRFFLENAARTGLDPLMRQIYFVKRKGKGTIQVGIDGFRLIADRTRCYAGSDEPVFDREDARHPNKASVTVWKLVAGQRCPFTASARWSEYCPEEGQDFQWQRMPYLMLAKCAEAQALRKGFPAELSGVYVDAEMDQAGADPVADAGPVDTSIEFASTRGRRVTDAPTVVVRQSATLRQLKFIQAIGREAGLADQDLDQEAFRLYGSAVAHLSRRDASAFVEFLQARRGPRVEHDEEAVVDADGVVVETNPDPSASLPLTPPPTPRADRITQQDMRRLHAAAGDRKINHADLHGIVGRKFGLPSTKDLTRTMLDDLVKWFNEATDEEIADELMALAVENATPTNTPMPGMPAAPQEPSGFWNS